MREHWSRFAIANKSRRVGPKVTRIGGGARKKKAGRKNQSRHTLSFLIVHIGQVEKIGSLSCGWPAVQAIGETCVRPYVTCKGDGLLQTRGRHREKLRFRLLLLAIAIVIEDARLAWFSWERDRQ